MIAGILSIFGKLYWTQLRVVGVHNTASQVSVAISAEDINRSTCIDGVSFKLSYVTRKTRPKYIKNKFAVFKKIISPSILTMSAIFYLLVLITPTP